MMYFRFTDVTRNLTVRSADPATGSEGAQCQEELFIDLAAVQEHGERLPARPLRQPLPPAHIAVLSPSKRGVQEPLDRVILPTVRPPPERVDRSNPLLLYLVDAVVEQRLDEGKERVEVMYLVDQIPGVSVCHGTSQASNCWLVYGHTAIMPP